MMEFGKGAGKCALAGLGAFLLTTTALADPITYFVNYQVGSGSVVGKITTDGSTGVLSPSHITSWNLTVTGIGASTVLTSIGSQSAVELQGADLTATRTQLLFNYSGADNGYFAVQAYSPGLYSGSKYWCNDTNWWGCQVGASVVPQSYTDSSAIFDHSFTGLHVLGTAGISESALMASLQQLANAREAQLIVNLLQSMTLVGLNEQVSCGNCGGGSASFGSFNLAAHGRYALTSEWTLLGGVDVGENSEKGTDVRLNLGFSGAIQYDPEGFGDSRPYAMVGLSGSYQDLRYHRGYDNGDGQSVGVGTTHGYGVGAFAEVGWVDRLTPRDEIAAYASYSRNWQMVAGYAETSDANPFAATVPGGTDITDTTGLSVQATHLFGSRIEAGINGGVEWAFHVDSAVQANVSGLNLSVSQPDFIFYQLGGRLGVRLDRDTTIDFFVNGILAPDKIGSSVHGGVGVRWNF